MKSDSPTPRQADAVGETPRGLSSQSSNGLLKEVADKLASGGVVYGQTVPTVGDASIEVHQPEDACVLSYVQPLKSADAVKKQIADSCGGNVKWIHLATYDIQLMN